MNNQTQTDGQYCYYGLTPPVINVVWEEDHARISWTDSYAGLAVFDVYESRNLAPFTFVATTAAGATFYLNHTWQNENMRFQVVARIVGGSSQQSGFASIRTPLCFWTDQIPAAGLTIDNLTIGGAGVVRVDWGDGLFDVYPAGVNVPVHVYVNPALYAVQLSGDVDLITTLDINTEPLAYGDLSRWTLPAGLLNLVLTGCAFTGDLSAWRLPAGLLTLLIGNNLFFGDLSSWFLIGMPAGMTNIVMTVGNVFSGDVPTWLMGVIMPPNIVEIDARAQLLSGHLKEIGFPAGAAAIDVNFHDCHFASPPRGNFRWVRTLDMSDNYCTQEEIDAFLCHLNECFTLGVVPLVNLTVDLRGVNMGSPSGGQIFNSNIISLTAKYIAAAVIFTITTN